MQRHGSSIDDPVRGRHDILADIGADGIASDGGVLRLCQVEQLTWMLRQFAARSTEGDVLTPS